MNQSTCQTCGQPATYKTVTKHHTSLRYLDAKGNEKWMEDRVLGFAVSEQIFCPDCWRQWCDRQEVQS